MSSAATASADAATRKPQPQRPFWREAMAPYAKPRLAMSLTQIATSVVPYLALSLLMYLALDVSYWLTLALAVPASGFLVRIYILFHDCTHGSFMESKRANSWLGMFFGLFVFSNYGAWRHSHAVHHATAGDLDRRGEGDVPTMTLAEYRALDWKPRTLYRLFRSPMILFTIGPIYSLVVQPRLVSKTARPRIKRNVWATNVALVVLVGGLCWAMGWKEYLLVQGPTVLLGGAAGIWLFYVQHQFEDVYWENTDTWSYADAALQGSSYLRLPRVLQFFAGNINFHHVHHLSARIPNYNLQRAHDENEIFHDVPTLSFWDGMRTLRLKVYDEQRGRMIGWSEAKQPPGEAYAAASATA